MCMSIEWRSLRKFVRSVLRNCILKLGKNAWAPMAAPKSGAKTVELRLIASD